MAFERRNLLISVDIETKLREENYRFGFIVKDATMIYIYNESSIFRISCLNDATIFILKLLETS